MWWPTKKQIEGERKDDTAIHLIFKPDGSLRTINNESDRIVAVDVDGTVTIKGN